MSIRSFVMVVSVALAAITVSSAATAATMQLIATGTVSGSYDHTGIFGEPGGSVDGQTVTLRIVFDTEQGIHDTEASGGYDQVYGGRSHGARSPALSAAVTVGRQTRSIAATDWSYFYLCEPLWCGAEASGAEAGTGARSGDAWVNESFAVHLYGSGMNLPRSIETPFTYVATPTTRGAAIFRIDSFDPIAWSYNYNSYVSFSIDSLSVSRIDIAPVPLPAAGLPLLAALGGLGLAARKRRKAA